MLSTLRSLVVTSRRQELILSLRMTSPNPLLCHPLVSVSNGASHIEEDEDEDEDEQGEKFEFGDGDDTGPTEMSSDSLMMRDWTTETAVSNLYAKTNTAQETVRQGMNGPFSTGQKDPNVSLCQSHCSGMEIRESPEGRSTSSDLGVTGESESFWKASSIYEGKPSLIGEDDQDISSSAVNGYSPQQDTAEAEVSSSVSPQINTPRSCSPASVVRDTEVIYDDVPAESIQYPMEDVDDIYEDIQRPYHRGSNGWSSSEFESYDELSDSDTVPPAHSSSKLPADVLRLKERCAVTRKEFAVRLSAPHVANIRQSCDTKVQQLMKAARSGTKDGLEKTKLAMIRRVSFLQRKHSTGSLRLNAAHMDTGMLGNVQHQQDTKNLHQELKRAVENDSGGQLKANCTINIKCSIYHGYGSA